MKNLLKFSLLVILSNFFTSCNGQTKNNNQTTNQPTIQKNKIVGGGCDGCEIMFVGMPTHINATDTSAGWNAQGQKL